MKWEYKTIAIDTEGWFLGGKLDIQKLDAILNDSGADGWELIATTGTAQAYGASRLFVATFKRQKN